MTEPTDHDATDDLDAAPKRRLRDVYESDPVDGLLLTFQELCNSKTLQFMGITVTTNGSVISGSVIGRDQYVEELLGTMRASGGFGEILADALRILDRQSEDEAEEDQAFAQYLHLKDAQVWLPSGPSPKGLWRCRLSEIDGWTLGSISQS